MNKKIAIAAILSGALLINPANSYAANQSTVTGNTSSIQFNVNGDVKQSKDIPVSIDGHTYISAASIGSMFNQYVDWNEFTSTISFTGKPQLTGKYTLQAPDLEPGIKMGMGSTLLHIPGDPDNVFYSSTDRGPNGDMTVDGKDIKTFPIPKFTPTIYKISIESGKITILETIPLKINGINPITGNEYISGLPNVKGHDDPAYDVTGTSTLNFDPYGLDLEGLAYNPSDDTFWMSEEYGPSIVQIKRDGTVIQRIVPKGLAASIESPAVPLKETLPAVYGERRSNRGLEALSITPDGKWMFTAIQSPLRNPDKSVDNSRVLRIAKINLSTLQVEAEYAYVTENVQNFNKLKQSDIVISDIYVVNENMLLVDERDKNAGKDAQLKKIYMIDLSKSTNVTGKYDNAKAGQTLEQMSVADLKAKNIVTPTKRTLLDAVEFQYPYEKIEGITLVGGNKLVIINDNDFGVAGGPVDGNGTGLWTFELPQILK